MTDFKFEITGEILKGSEVNEMEALAQRADSIKITGKIAGNDNSDSTLEEVENQKVENGSSRAQNESELHEIDEGDILRQFHCDIDSVEQLMAEGYVHNLWIIADYDP